jgi:hypothetical protein
MLEVLSINDTLIRNGQPSSLKTLRKAILMDAERLVPVAAKEKYPPCGFGLVSGDPNGKKKKGKKKKGKKRKK